MYPFDYDSSSLLSKIFILEMYYLKLQNLRYVKAKDKCEHTHTNLNKFYVKYIVYCIRRKHRNHFLVTRLRPWLRTGISGGSIRCVRGPDTGWSEQRGRQNFSQSELDRFSPSYTERTKVHNQYNFWGVDKTETL